MSFPRPILVSLVAVAAIALVLAVSARRLTAARTELSAALERQESVRKDATEALRLRSEKARVELREPPRQDVIAQVTAVLGAAGLPSGRFRELDRDSDVALDERSSAGGRRLRRQSLRLTLGEMAVPELGSFLAEWHERVPAWSVSRIEMTRETKASARESYQVRLQIEATYIADTAKEGGQRR